MLVHSKHWTPLNVQLYVHTPTHGHVTFCNTTTIKSEEVNIRKRTFSIIHIRILCEQQQLIPFRRILPASNIFKAWQALLLRLPASYPVLSLILNWVTELMISWENQMFAKYGMPREESQENIGRIRVVAITLAILWANWLRRSLIEC